MNRIISEELTKEFALLLSHQLIQCEAPDRPFYQKMFDELRSSPAASGMDPHNMGGVDAPYFLSTLRRFLERELVSDEVSEALLANVKLLDKHLATLPSQPVEPVAGQVDLDFILNGWGKDLEENTEWDIGTTEPICVGEEDGLPINITSHLGALKESLLKALQRPHTVEVVWEVNDSDLELMVRKCLANAKQLRGGYDAFLSRHIAEGIKSLRTHPHAVGGEKP